MRRRWHMTLIPAITIILALLVIVLVARKKRREN